MLRFRADVCCHTFSREIGLVLHLASVWSMINGVDVDVLAMIESAEPSSADRPVVAGVWLTVRVLDDWANGDLAGYLTMTLSSHYDVVTRPSDLAVTWYARGARASVAPARSDRVVGEG